MMGGLGSSGGVGDGFVFLEASPLSCGVVHFKHCVHQHGGAARAVRFRQHLCVLAELDLDDVALLGAWVLCSTHTHAQEALASKANEMIEFLFIFFFFLIEVVLPLDPAMKPKMRAFSGLVTLLAVLNISWAAYIWSL